MSLGEVHVHTPHIPDIKPNGFWQIVQTGLTSLVLLIASYVATWAHDSAKSTEIVLQKQNDALIMLQAQMTLVQTQLAETVAVNASLVKIVSKLEVKMEDVEQRVHDVEQIRRPRG
jgi:hypothetical protein